MNVEITLSSGKSVRLFKMEKETFDKMRLALIDDSETWFDFVNARLLIRARSIDMVEVVSEDNT